MAGFTIDMTIAKDVHRTNIRIARKEKLEALDIEFVRALETGASTTEIATKKQTLRDMPADSAINAAGNETALKAHWDESALGTKPQYY